MLFERLNEEKEKEIMQKVMKGKIKELDEFIDRFQPLMRKLYNIESKKGYRLNEEDFIQQCKLIIIESLKGFRGTVFGELCNYIDISLNNGIKNFMKKKNNYEKHNLLGKEEDYIYNLKASYLGCSLEEKIVYKITILQNYKKFIKNKLPKKQEEAVIVFCLGEEAVRKYILKTGIKRECFRKRFNRAIANIEKIINMVEHRQVEG